MLRNGKLSNAIDKNRKKLQTALCKNRGKLSGGGVDFIPIINTKSTIAL